MIRPGHGPRLRLLGSASDPFDDLLAALELWASADPGEPPVAHLEVGDGELLVDFLLTATKVAELTVMLAGSTARAPSGPLAARQAKTSRRAPARNPRTRPAPAT